jgi:hypothetical protein
MKKTNKELIIASISLIVSIVSLFFSGYLAVINLNLSIENSRLSNFNPSISSNYNYSTLRNSGYMRNESFAPVAGQVKIDLTVLTPHYGKLEVNLKSLNYSESDYYWLDLEKQGSVSYSGKKVYECFVQQGLNKIVAEFDLHEYIAVKPNVVSIDTKGFSFPLGELTLEGILTDLQANQTVTREFTEGIRIDIKVTE